MLPPPREQMRSRTEILLFARLSTTVTAYPACISSTQVCEPMNPRPPVTNIIPGTLSTSQQAHGSQCGRPRLDSAAWQPAKKEKLAATEIEYENQRCSGNF